MQYIATGISLLHNLLSYPLVSLELSVHDVLAQTVTAPLIVYVNFTVSCTMQYTCKITILCAIHSYWYFIFNFLEPFQH